MQINRRNFLKTIGISSLAVPAIASSLSSCKPIVSHSPFGIQLWTVKEDMAKDKIATLQLLSDYGYEIIESFTGEEGLFWGMKPKDFQILLDDLGMKLLSSHIDPKFTVEKDSEDEFKQLVEDAASIEMTHLFNPYPGLQEDSADWYMIAEGLNRQGEICKAAGLTMGYHNHNHEFILTPDGDLPFDILLKNTNPDLVEFELDMYWAVWAKQDPISLFNNNPNRITFAHFKDLYGPEKVQQLLDDPNEIRTEEWAVQASTVLGTGQIDFEEILNVGSKNGLQTLIVEQERFDGSSPLEDAKKNAEFMKNLLSK